ncbi:MAG: glycosyltransferase [Patescibacteria group bacterium]
MTKKKLLLISAISPFPMDSGGAVRSFNTLKYMSQYFDIHYIFFKSRDYTLTNQDIEFLKQTTKTYYVIPLGLNKTETAFLSDMQPYWFSEWMNDELKILLLSIIRKFDIDLVQLDYTQIFYLYDYIPKGCTVVGTAVDISTISFWRRINEVKKHINMPVLYYRLLQVYLYEKRFSSKFDLLVVMSKKDEVFANNLLKVNKPLIVQNGIDMLHVDEVKSPHKKLILGYIGSFNHSPNRYAVEYFILNIAPLLEEKGIDFEYIIAGNNSQREVSFIVQKSLLKDKTRIRDIGFVKDLKDFYKSIDILVAAIKSGSGTRIKILESLSYQVPVVTTPIGGEGLEDLNSLCLQIVNTDEEFVDAIKTANNLQTFDLNPTLQNYTWKVIFEKYVDYLRSMSFFK